MRLDIAVLESHVLARDGTEGELKSCDDLDFVGLTLELAAVHAPKWRPRRGQVGRSGSVAPAR
eukprot:13808560-Alexandrium_andersonii.AAC.1